MAIKNATFLTVQMCVTFLRHFEHWLIPAIFPSSWASCPGLSGCLPRSFSCFLDRTAAWYNVRLFQSLTSLYPGFENLAPSTAIVISRSAAFKILLQKNSVQTMLGEKSAFARAQKYYCCNYSPILPHTNHLKFNKGNLLTRMYSFLFLQKPV